MQTKINKEFVDYPDDQIAAKLAQIDRFEREHKPNATSKSWRKWCTDYNYRKCEWEFRQAVANSIKPNINYYKENTVL